jgi:biopolymer transport protein ExbD
MAIQAKQADDAIISEINITPLTDVMLVLLIIFMVTATFFVTQPAMQVELPSAISSERIPKTDGEITVFVNQDGSLCIADKPIKKEELSTALIEAAKMIHTEPKTVVVKGDNDAAYGQIIWIMDSARLVGLRNISLATKNPE